MAFRSITIGLGSADTASPAKPSGVIDGDILTIAVRAPTASVTILKSDGITSAGFSSLAAATTDGDTSRPGEFCTFTKVAASEPASYVINISGGDGTTFGYAIVAHSGRNGVGTATATNDAGAGNSPVSIPLSGVTASSGDDILIFNDIEATNASGTWAITTQPASYTDRGSQADTGTFQAGLLNVCTRDNVSGGATGTLTSSATLAATQGESCGIVIRIPVASGDTTAPSLSAGPSVSGITASGFDVKGTPDENGSAYLIVTSVGASQPANATFDASTEAASMTASAEFTINHTGS